MNITIQEVTAGEISEGAVSGPSRSTSEFGAVEIDQSAVSTPKCDAARMPPIPKSTPVFRPLRFTTGLLSAASGAALILSVGLRLIDMQDFSDDFAMPLVAICVLLGVMLLGGGFGIMATSSSGFDEGEFDRLANAGNISAVSQSARSDNDVVCTT